MCHLLLGLPLFALPIFWLLPLAAAVPLYVAATAVSLGVYVLALKAMHTPRMNGGEAMLGTTGRVVDIGERGAMLLLHGELWSADGDGGNLAIGDEAVVVGIEGLRLKARKRGDDRL